MNNSRNEHSDNTCLYITGKGGSFISFLIAHLDKKILVLYEDEDLADLWREEMEYYGNRDIAVFPPFEGRFFEQEDTLKRTGFLYRLTTDDRFIGLFPVTALAAHLPAPGEISEGILTLTVGQPIFIEDVHDYLETKAYELTPLVREKGQYAKRGSILDFFPPDSDKPIRCEFIGDQILSLRYFNVLSQ
ncbi:MAG: hypothetical protein ABFD12_08515, partial [Syntrophorhabdus sp.]